MAAKSTPVMKQHAAAKAAHPDCIIFFRLGDFYEMFGADAVVVSRELDLTLTSRNKGKPDEIPMAGVPHHAAHGYIARLIQRGHKVAVCEQMADPATVKGIVPREVVRVITPGTWLDETRVAGEENNFLCALELVDQEVGIALLDLTTAELLAAAVPDVSAVLAELSRATPSEIIVGHGLDQEAMKSALAQILPKSQIRHGEELSKADLMEAAAGLTFGVSHPAAVAAAGRALHFARQCYCNSDLLVWRVSQLNPTGILGLDQAAQRHLELVSSTVDDEKTTLYSTINRTASPGGARLLRRRLLAPLTDIAQIRRRQDEVETLVNNPKVRDGLLKALKRVGDLERLAVRGAQREASPKDLGHVRTGLVAARAALDGLRQLPDDESRKALGLDETLDCVDDLRELLERALVERPPAQPKEGAVFLREFDAELDELSELRTTGSERVSQLEDELRKTTGVSNLRVKFTRVFGWYVEVSRSQSAKVPKDWRRKQTVATGERFTMPELDDLAEQIQLADARYRQRELSLLEELSDALCGAAQRIHQLAAWLCAWDVAAALAEVATAYDYCRPLVDDSDQLEILDGRHPVVERRAAAGRFVPNDVRLEIRKNHLWLISGPNMAGKSTFLRQVALIVILAQMGAYVPAKAAHIGVFDRVLSRVGASDNLAGGESTFMVEMRETANILRSATSRSLVILDEVGRGTSTFDGLSIAWAVAEHLDTVIGCRALFATHYHELTRLADKSTSAMNYSVSAREHEGDVIFLHRVMAGSASRSYGVAVAQLAGLPESVLARSRALLESFENDRLVSGPGNEDQARASTAQLDLFAPPSSDARTAEVAETLKQLDPDRMTGIEALQLLVQLRRLLGESVPSAKEEAPSDENQAREP